MIANVCMLQKARSDGACQDTSYPFCVTAIDRRPLSQSSIHTCLCVCVCLCQCVYAGEQGAVERSCGRAGVRARTCMYVCVCRRCLEKVR